MAYTSDYGRQPLGQFDTQSQNALASARSAIAATGAGATPQERSRVLGNIYASGAANFQATDERMRREAARSGFGGSMMLTPMIMGAQQQGRANTSRRASSAIQGFGQAQRANRLRSAGLMSNFALQQAGLDLSGQRLGETGRQFDIGQEFQKGQAEQAQENIETRHEDFLEAQDYDRGVAEGDAALQREYDELMRRLMMEDRATSMEDRRYLLDQYDTAGPPVGGVGGGSSGRSLGDYRSFRNASPRAFRSF